jgi:hypothetical protein
MLEKIKKGYKNVFIRIKILSPNTNNSHRKSTQPQKEKLNNLLPTLFSNKLCTFEMRNNNIRKGIINKNACGKTI